MFQLRQIENEPRTQLNFEVPNDIGEFKDKCFQIIRERSEDFRNAGAVVMYMDEAYTHSFKQI